MATVVDVLSDAAAHVEAQLAAAVRLGSDFRDDLEAIPAAATRYQLRGGPAGIETTGSNTLELVLAALAIEIHRALGAGESETDWTESATRLDALKALLDASGWRALASVFDLESVELSTGREGNIITDRLDVVVQVAP